MDNPTLLLTLYGSRDHPWHRKACIQFYRDCITWADNESVVNRLVDRKLHCHASGCPSEVRVFLKRTSLNESEPGI